MMGNTDKRKSKDSDKSQVEGVVQIPFDEALRKMLNPPSHQIKPKQRNKKTGQ